ncbi:hypothetical protein POVCU2_0010460 [Plasmodium ovale curtisi]|uniref:Uncharacterized protein n=1 Tax=Plasmodium ovale curtisi TaxID=864141 RepID=A0A1A8VYI8_PLAOA|nr:hypothetical protein POVCU2_0010460 [Plasmodium ovale curtisi]SBS83920.1 hypothetical protein POVCU1_009570 [Plasmodium ovale curtisi]
MSTHDSTSVHVSIHSHIRANVGAVRCVCRKENRRSASIVAAHSLISGGMVQTETGCEVNNVRKYRKFCRRVYRQMDIYTS